MRGTILPVVSTQSHDDGFHEIQLNGKQLVFLFMAATVVSVVIFLSGVMVGRGVQTEQRTSPDTVVLSDGPAAVPPSGQTSTPSSAPAVSPDADPRTADAPPAVDDLSYFSRLEQSTPPAETLKPVPEPERAAPRVAEPPPSPPAREPAPPRPRPAAAPAGTPDLDARSTTAAAASRPAQPGDWTVQVAALNARPEAEAVAKRLAAKGYSAYVVTPGDGTPSVFRVRIGPFSTRREADNMAAKLEREERFKPWVTR